MQKPAVQVARSLILALQVTPCKGLGGYSDEAFASRGVDKPFPQATREAAHFREFFGLFPNSEFIRHLFCNKDVLDFGSGYGGRTVEYLMQCDARSVCGVEPVPRHIELSNAYIDSRGIQNCTFRLCTDRDIPLPDASVDLVVSYDVLEHVMDPRRSMREIHRVLRPHGKAVMSFPLYDGALSHHLDYLARLPGLHWFFSPETLVKAVNSILESESGKRRFGTPRQPDPKPAYDGSRNVLPTLNGLTGDGFQALVDGFDIELLYFRPILANRGLLGLPTRSLLKMGVKGRARDAICSNVASILRKS